MTSRRRSPRLLLLVAVVPLLVSLHARRAGADSYCDQECDTDPGGCNGKQVDDCYSSCETNRDRQMSRSSTPPPPSTSTPWQPDPPAAPPAPVFDDDAGAAGDASFD